MIGIIEKEIYRCHIDPAPYKQSYGIAYSLYVRAKHQDLSLDQRIKNLLKLKLPIPKAGLHELLIKVKELGIKDHIHYPALFKASIQSLKKNKLQSEIECGIEIHHEKLAYLIWFKKNNQAADNLRYEDEGSHKKIYQIWELYHPKTIIYAASKPADTYYTKEERLKVAMNEKKFLWKLQNKVQVPKLYASFSYSGEEHILIMKHYCKDFLTFLNDLKPHCFTDQMKLDFGIELMTQLANLHQQGIVHRDIKPENLFLDKRGTLILADFGLSTTIEDLKNDSTLVGSYPYAPYEVLTRQSHLYGTKADIWSAACILWILWSDNQSLYPWHKYLDKDVNSQSITDTIITIDVYNSMIISPDEKAALLIQNMLQKDPANRLSAEEALKRMQQLKADWPKHKKFTLANEIDYEF